MTLLVNYLMCEDWHHAGYIYYTSASSLINQQRCPLCSARVWRFTVPTKVPHATKAAAAAAYRLGGVDASYRIMCKNAVKVEPAY